MVSPTFTLSLRRLTSGEVRDDQASFVVPPRSPGLSMGRKLTKTGIRACHTAEVILRDVTLPGACLLGGKDRLDERVSRALKAGQARSSPTLVAFEATLPAIAAQAVGIARAACEHVLENAKQQSAPGLRGTEREAIALKLADMRTRTDVARLLYMRAASMAMRGKPFTAGEGAMAKLFVGETAVFVTEQAVEIRDDCGCSQACPLERWQRDSIAHMSFGGTSEVQRLLIGRARCSSRTLQSRAAQEP